MRTLPSMLFPALALAVAACHSAPPPAPAKAPEKAAPAASAAPQTAPGHLRRPDVDQVLVQQGPAWVFRRVIGEEVLGRDGRFTGWRLVGLPEEWRGIDLRPGDVVTRINGLPLERPEQAWEVWTSVAKHPDLKISVMRDGGPREVVIPIDGAPSPETLKLLNRESPAPRASAAPPPRKGSVQIGGGAETPEDEAY